MRTNAVRPSQKVAPSSSQNYASGYSVIGTRPIRHDGLEKVTGRARYGADINLPGLLHAKVLRSPHAHARILNIDASEALKMPGVKAVATAADMAIVKTTRLIDRMWESPGDPRITAENSLAGEKALYKGHSVAAVAATSPHVAEEALKRINVDYEVLEPVLDVRDAMKAGAPLLHEKMTTHNRSAVYGRGDDTGVPSNVAGHVQFKQGDIDQGFRDAEVVVEKEFTTRGVHQGYIEPHVSTALWAPDGRITIWTSTQGHFPVRSVVSAVLGVPEHTVRVIPMEIGGGFGGKIPSYLDIACALLSRKTGHPVKAAMTRKEVFEASGPTSGSYMRARIGATQKGEITAAEVYMAFEAGAFPGSAVGIGAMTALAPYSIENSVLDGFDVTVNKPRVQAYRAPGSPMGAMAVESVVDELACKLGMDPLELRLKNAVKEGDRLPPGMPLKAVGCIQVEEAMKAHPHYTAPLEGPNRGRGVAMGFWGNGGMASSATLTVNSDGTVSSITGSVDIGGSRLAIAMQAAEVLGISAEDVVPSVGDTDSIGYTAGTGASRTAFATGIAAIGAAEKVRDEMIARAALIWEVKPEDVKFEKGTFINNKRPEERLTFKQVAARLLATGGPLSTSFSSSPTSAGPAYCGNIVDVEVDSETGKVDILRYTVVEDVGQPAHPSYVEGQMQGGTVQGIGWALNEEYFYSDDGTVLNSSFLDYRMPTSLDLPMIDTVLVEVPNPGHPFGLRGVGEVSIVPPLAAIANAVSRATGARMTQLPMSPGAVREALEKHGK